jgi:DMSO/TMAO reductase YedYZ molybdopterin-dependent catalytic subunit
VRSKAGEQLVGQIFEGAAASGDHGAPVRVVSPDQYGYISVKHLCRIELHTAEPTGFYASPAFRFLLKPHSRVRGWEEERHRDLLSRLLIPPIASLSVRRGHRVRPVPHPARRRQHLSRYGWLGHPPTRRQHPGGLTVMGMRLYTPTRPQWSSRCERR